ncbi:hypothetical protein CP967_08500 [Streptomyces nitrosporeus]|uniref:DNA-binding phage zinc finger domain-containing protein n=1 Tax=Streptomyces nitrosporeus TaxID=28894 RepID=A0A5J6F756_9ACTN|nr:hypothetical protein [Streptomyces nitrosporeus]QEU72002.1 hypothetical protein CP967_08500 [Streptomyces nitrosporeus]GGY81355.1 hypothetical protein GCM10010327_10020 [Streptomyces nitrosporeus]
MTPDQIPQLLKQVSYADPRVLPEDPKEVAGLAALWATVLADVPVEFAMQAVGIHYARSPYPIKPSDISTRWQAVVRDRMQRDVDPAPPVDPDNESAYRHALAAHRRAVATGQEPPVEHHALTAGPAAAEADRRRAVIGKYIPIAVDDALAAYRPQRAARLAVLREGRPDALAVPCPVETCRAAVGTACTRPGKGQTRHRLAGPHPSRVDYAAERAA